MSCFCQYWRIEYWLCLRCIPLPRLVLLPTGTTGSSSDSYFPNRRLNICWFMSQDSGRYQTRYNREEARPDLSTTRCYYEWKHGDTTTLLHCINRVAFQFTAIVSYITTPLRIAVCVCHSLRKVWLFIWPLSKRGWLLSQFADSFLAERNCYLVSNRTTHR